MILAILSFCSKEGEEICLGTAKIVRNMEVFEIWMFHVTSKSLLRGFHRSGEIVIESLLYLELCILMQYFWGLPVEVAVPSQVKWKKTVISPFYTTALDYLALSFDESQNTTTQKG